MKQFKKTYKVIATWSVWFWQAPRKKEFFTTNILLAENAFDEFLRQKAGEILLIEINEKKEKKVIKSYSITSSTSSSSTYS